MQASRATSPDSSRLCPSSSKLAREGVESPGSGGGISRNSGRRDSALEHQLEGTEHRTTMKRDQVLHITYALVEIESGGRHLSLLLLQRRRNPFCFLGPGQAKPTFETKQARSDTVTRKMPETIVAAFLVLRNNYKSVKNSLSCLCRPLLSYV